MNHRTGTTNAPGIVFLAMTFVILSSSVHLGWHYAMDGCVAVLATRAMWPTVGRALRHPPVARVLLPADARP
jgi:hypothetical protein